MNNITIELCAEDRARIERLTAALEALQPPTLTIQNPAADLLTAGLKKMAGIQETPTETAQEVTETPEEPTTPATPPTEEAPTAKADEVEATPPVTLGQIQQKVTELVAVAGGKKKAQVREIVNAYAKKVSDLPADKLPEVWSKLLALESEA